MKTINNFSIIKKNIILRVDLNVPVVDGVISDITKIISIKSTIKKLIKTKNKVFLVSHFGRPKGEFKKNLSLKFICHTLSKQLAVKKVHFINSFRVEEIENIQKIMQCDEICLFDNIRFYQEEENNDLIFSKKIAKCFDVFINDAFSASHRSHASIVGITNYLPSLAGDNLIKLTWIKPSSPSEILKYYIVITSPIDTEFLNSKNFSSFKNSPDMVSAKFIAEKIFSLIEKPKERLFIGSPAKLLATKIAFFHPRFFRKIIEKKNAPPGH